MREIKFRVWDGHEIVYFDLELCNSESPLWFIKTVKEGVVMQFTGLHDKNGREIYEGDVVFAHGNGSNYLVKFGTHRSEHDTECFEHGFYVQHHTGFQEALSGASEFLEVIGNIHENPELLE